MKEWAWWCAVVFITYQKPENAKRCEGTYLEKNECDGCDILDLNRRIIMAVDFRLNYSVLAWAQGCRPELQTCAVRVNWSAMCLLSAAANLQNQDLLDGTNLMGWNSMRDKGGGNWKCLWKCGTGLRWFLRRALQYFYFISMVPHYYVSFSQCFCLGAQSSK